jgi:hypothetical protein
MPKLFYDDEFDALQQTIAGSERNFMECAVFLRPGMKPESAYAWLKACVNPSGDQNLKFGQIVSLARFCKRFDALFFMADELLHQRPEQRNPEDEKARFQRKFAEAVARLDEIAEEARRAGIWPLRAAK